MHVFQNACSTLKSRLIEKQVFCEEDDYVSHQWCTKNYHQRALFVISTGIAGVDEPVFISAWHFLLSSLPLKLTQVFFQAAGIIDQSKIQSSSKFKNTEKNSIR